MMIGFGGHGVGAPPPPNMSVCASCDDAGAFIVKTEQMLNRINVAVAIRNFINFPPWLQRRLSEWFDRDMFAQVHARRSLTCHVIQLVKKPPGVL
jgi:hypothetical protein